MGNQQERLFKLGWFVGALESEGCVSLVKSCRNKQGYRYTPIVHIVNASNIFFSNCIEFLKENNIPFYMYPRKRGNCKNLIIRGYKRVEKLLDLILPYMSVKRDRAKLLNSFIKYRLSVHYKTPYGVREELTYTTMKRLNKIPRDYTPDVKSDDIVRSHMKV